MEKDEDNFDKRLAYTLFTCGVFSNFIGVITCLCKSYPSNFIKIINYVTVGTSLFLLVFTTFIFLAFIKNYTLYSIIIAALTGFVLFPAMFISTGNLSGSFIFYFFIIAASFGVAIRKPIELIIPLFALAFYIILFELSYAGKIPLYDASKPFALSKVQVYSGFISTYLFILFSTFYVTQVTLKSRSAYKELSSKDELTGLYNRRSLDNDLKNGNYRFGIMLDIDNFKKINDTYSHQMGDMVLKNLAKIVLEQCTNEFRIYRYGGEEFFIISRFDTKETFLRLKRIYSSIHKDLYILSQPVTISSGIAENNNDLSPEELIEEADKQLYVSKNNGKDQISFMNIKVDIKGN